MVCSLVGRLKRQIWAAIVNVEFTVRSAYHLQLDRIALAKGE
jgi:hypothetical protein